MHRAVAVTISALCVCYGCSAVLDFEECSRFQDCQGHGLGFVCRDSMCVAPPKNLYDEKGQFACRVYPTDPPAILTDSSTQLIGALLPLSESDGPPMEDAARLAVDQINGVGGVDGHKLLLVSCNDKGSGDYGPVVADYLVNLVGVKAIVGGSYSGATIAMATKVAIPGGAVMISPSASSPAISDLADNDLIWRLVPSDAFQGQAMGEFVRQQNLKNVAVLYKNDAYGTGLHDAFVAKMVDLKRDGDLLYQFRYPDPGKPGEGFSAVAVATELVKNPKGLPDIIVGIGTSELAAIIREVETKDEWTDAGKRPIWLLGDGGRLQEVLDMLADLKKTGKSEWIRATWTRVRGTFPASDQAKNYAIFKGSYEGAFKKTPEAFTEHAYDATYMLALSLATFDGAITGAKVAAGLRKLIAQGAKKYDVRPDAFQAAVSELKTGASIDLEGASGDLNLDVKGEPPVGPITLWWIVDSDGNGTLGYGEGRILGSDGKPLTVDVPEPVIPK